MRTHLCPVVLAVLGAVVAAPGGLSQEDLRHRPFSEPRLLHPDVLDRLHLRQAWSEFIPVESRRDGIYTVQLVPGGPEGTQLLVQTRSGLVAVLEGETGRTAWSARVGGAYRNVGPLAYNRDSVFVLNNVTLHALDRRTGNEQWSYILPEGITAGIVADNAFIHVSQTGRGLVSYRLPAFGREGRPRPEEGLSLPGVRGPAGPGIAGSLPIPAVGTGVMGGQPFGSGYIGGASATLTGLRTDPVTVAAVHNLGRPPELPPVVGNNQLLVPMTNGTMVGLPRSALGKSYEIPTRGQLMLRPGQHGDMAYVPNAENLLFAVNMDTGDIRWRFPTGAPPRLRPAVLDTEVYLPVFRTGMYSVNRLDRQVQRLDGRVETVFGGAPLWFNAQADRFLAANPKFVYALDESNRLMILDHARGTTLTSYPCTHDYLVPVVNEWTDRVYLMAHNGLVVALHDRDYPKPLAMKVLEDQRAPEKPGTKPPGRPPGTPDGGKPGAGQAGAGKPADKPEDKPEGDKPAGRN